MSSTSDAIRIVAAAHAHPAHELTNEELADRVPDLSEGWLEDVLGIRSRRVMGMSENLPQLAESALAEAVASAGWDSRSIDAVICGTSFVDDILPATASLISSTLCPDAVAFDVNAACASALYSLEVARSLLISDPSLQRMAVCAAERPSAWADYQDRESSVFWGDSAGCLLVERTSEVPGFEVVGTTMHNDNVHADKVRVRRGGSFHHDGRYSFQQVIRLSSMCVNELLDRHGVGVGDISRMVCHQSNPRLLQALSDEIGVPWSHQWHNVTWAGNQGGAGVMTAFSDGWARDRTDLSDGDLAVLVAVGGGYSSAAALLRWHG